jgi:hypothetical protein
MRTIEEIMKDHCDMWNPSKPMTWYDSNVKAAMEEYAKQEAVGFLTWAEKEEGYTYIDQLDIWTRGAGLLIHEISREELYEIYLKNKTKK